MKEAAACQDDWETFERMRKSQFLTWPQSLLYSYGNDLLNARQHQSNPITEKYARMMETTAPTRYAQIRDLLPPISQAKAKMVSEILPVQVAWMEEFHRQFPALAKQMRPIHTYEDTREETSAETISARGIGIVFR